MSAVSGHRKARKTDRPILIIIAFVGSTILFGAVRKGKVISAEKIVALTGILETDVVCTLFFKTDAKIE